MPGWRKLPIYRFWFRFVLPGSAGLLFGACSGPQSALDPAGHEAQRLADLFWWMTAGSVVIWLGVVGLTVFAIKARKPTDEARRASMLIIGGGVVVPTVVLAALLVYGLGMLPELLARAPEGSLKISVTGEQWWWRVRYELPDGRQFATANEIRLPVGQPVEFELDAPDVIHSFWIPALGGKMDMIPGRRTRIALKPLRTGKFRGVCAEYCGASHALMAFHVVVAEPGEFAQWVDRQMAPAAQPSGEIERRGEAAFAISGCSACHSIRGTDAKGLVGPDLTHVGSRSSLGAGILSNQLPSYLQWIASPDRIKPGVLMPHFRMLPQDEVEAIAAYLYSLK